MWQFKRDYEVAYRGRRDLKRARALHPGMLDFASWLKANKARIPVAQGRLTSMIRGGLNCLLKLALVGVWLPIAARADDARGMPQHLGDTGLYVAGSMSQVKPRRTAVFTAVPAVVRWSRQAPLDLAAAGHEHRCLEARCLGIPTRDQALEGIRAWPRARDPLPRARLPTVTGASAVMCGMRTAATPCSRPPRACAICRALVDDARRAMLRATPFPPRTTAAPVTKARRCRCSASARCSFRRIAIRWRRMPSACPTPVDLQPACRAWAAAQPAAGIADPSAAHRRRQPRGARRARLPARKLRQLPQRRGSARRARHDAGAARRGAAARRAQCCAPSLACRASSSRRRPRRRRAYRARPSGRQRDRRCA